MQIDEKELVYLQKLCEKIKYGRFLEIGTYNGGTVAKLATQFANIYFDCIDPFLPGHATAAGKKEMFLKNTKGLKNVCLYECTSDKALLQLQNDRYDIIFVDGDHAYWQVSKDLYNYYPHLIHGGYLFCHDYGYIDDVRRAVDEFAVDKKLKIETVEPISCVMVKGEKDE